MKALFKDIVIVLFVACLMGMAAVAPGQTSKPTKETKIEKVERLDQELFQKRATDYVKDLIRVFVINNELDFLTGVELNRVLAESNRIIQRVKVARKNKDFHRQIKKYGVDAGQGYFVVYTGNHMSPRSVSALAPKTPTDIFLYVNTSKKRYIAKRIKVLKMIDAFGDPIKLTTDPSKGKLSGDEPESIGVFEIKRKGSDAGNSMETVTITEIKIQAIEKKKKKKLPKVTVRAKSA